MTETGRILIVEDDPAIRELLADALRAEGHTPAATADCAGAFELAGRFAPDLLVTDVHLPDGSGLELLDRLRGRGLDLPAIVVTGLGDAPTASEASRRGCVDFLLKPLDLPRLHAAVEAELARRRRQHRQADRARRLRRLARHANRHRRQIRHELQSTCADLSAGYSTLSQQFALQQTLLGFQRQLIGCRNDDDVFRGLFEFHARRNGSLFGVAMLCDEHARLQIAGRFGMPAPDSLERCEQFAAALLPMVMANPAVTPLDGQDHAGLFPPELAGWLVGVSFLAMPLMPRSGQLIGLVLMYRKGEQPFTDEDVALAQLFAPAVAQAVQANARRDAA